MKKKVFHLKTNNLKMDDINILSNTEMKDDDEESIILIR